MAANARIKANAIDNLLRVQAFALRIGIQLIKVSHAQRQIGVGKQLDSLRLGESHEQCVDVLLNGAFLQQTGKLMRRFYQMLII